jgi:hypothetical protein
MHRFISLSLLFPCLLSTCISPNTIDPEFIYRNHFETPQEEIRNLIGHGYYFQGGDIWIRFEADKDIYPNDFKSYSRISDETVRTYFLDLFSELIADGVFEERELSSDINVFMTSGTLSCFEKRHLNEESHREHNYWFVTSGEGLHYFRSWTNG